MTNLEQLVESRTEARPRPRTARLGWIAPALLLGLMAVLMIGPAARQSAAIDEVPHIGAGLSYVQRLDMRLNGEHPPLAKVLAAVPLVAAGTQADYHSISWTFSEKYFQAYLAQWVFGEWVLGRWNERQRTLFLARVPMLLLTLALGLVVYLCARRLGGEAGGLLCLSAYVSMPVFLTFGSMVLTDVPVTLFTILTLWAFANLLQAPTRKNSIWFGVALAGALLSKFSAGLVLIAIAVYLRYTRRRAPRELWHGIGYAAVLVYVVYFVLSWNQPMDVQHRIGDGPIAHAIGRMLMPAWLYLRGAAMVVFTASRPAFLLGESFESGLPLYFPLLFLWKSPLGFLGLLLMAAFWVRKQRGELWRVIWVSCVVFAAACILSRLNISYRHFTTPLVLLILLLAPLPSMLGRRGKFAIAALAVFSVVTTVAAYPHFLPYVNALGFGRPAYQLFGDSNLDWNHALPEAAEFARSQGVEELLVDVYGLSDPSLDVPQARVWDCQLPSAAEAGRWAVVSSNVILESHNCSWLIPHIRQELAGGSMYAVRVPDPAPPPPEERRLLFSMTFDLRALMIDVTRNPERLPEAFALLESMLAKNSPAEKLYPPKEPVQWPWDRQ